MTDVQPVPGRALGKRPPLRDPRTLPLAKLLISRHLPSVPESVDFSTKVSPWPMFANDRIGDCLTEGTVVTAPGVRRAYRAAYAGPVVDLRTVSGKRLCVTRNHSILTTRGFVPAHALREGDYLISSDLPESVARRVDNHFDQVPAAIEDVFAAHQRVGAGMRAGSYVGLPIDFHGDALFFEGQVDVVDAYRLLWSDRLASSTEPERHSGLVAVGEAAESLDRGRSALSHSRSVGSPAPGFLGFGGVGPLLFGREAGRPENGGLADRPYLHASDTKPTADHLGVDAELVGELYKSNLAGSIAADRIVEVGHRMWRGHVYDLSTESHWYIANGIVSHNCTIATVAHVTQLQAALSGLTVRISDADVVRYYQRVTAFEGAGYNPKTGENDNGCVELDVLRYWRRWNFAGHRLYAFARTNVRDHDLVKTATMLFAGLYIGLNLPQSAADQIEHHQPWDDVGAGQAARPGTWGGHAVNIVGYDADGLSCVTWGSIQRMTWRFWDRYADEAYAILGDIWMRERDPHPAIDWTALKSYLSEVGSLVATSRGRD